MKRKLFVAAAAIALPIGLVGPPAAPVVAAPANAPAGTAATTVDAASPAMFAALQRDLRLSPDEARARLAREDKAARTDSRLRTRLGAAYAGAWLNKDATTLTVAVTSAAK